MTDSHSRRDVLHSAGILSLTGISAATLGSIQAQANASPTPALASIAEPFGPGPRSGLPWHSGGSLTTVAPLAAYRNRLCDTVTIWCGRDTWTDMLDFTGGFKVVKDEPERISVAIVPLPVTHSAVVDPGMWARAAAGEFDAYYQNWAMQLAASGRINMIVRIGWETNHTFSWFGGTDPVGFKATFARIARIVRQYNPTASIEWCNTKGGKQGGSVLDMYPGDTNVDIIGVDFYDGWPGLNTQAIWDRQYNATLRGGPYGLGAWLAFAKSRGKKLACPEWAIWTGIDGTTDNPLYIRKMFEFFSANATSIAYENYFNQIGEHQIVPPDVNPLAAAEYLRLWGRPLV